MVRGVVRIARFGGYPHCRRVLLGGRTLKTDKITKGKKIASIVGICLASVLIIFAFCGRYFGSGLKQFANFFLGSFGMAFYGLMAAIIVACSCCLAGKHVKIPAKYTVHFILLFVAVILFVHLLTTTYLPDNFKDITDQQGNVSAGYVTLVYNYYVDDLGVPTFGGVVFGSVVFALKHVLTIYGAIPVLLLIIAWATCMVGDFFYAYTTGKLQLDKKARRQEVSDIEPSRQTSIIVNTPMPVYFPVFDVFVPSFLRVFRSVMEIFT